MTSGEQINILLVDDRPENLLVLKATLGSLGCNLVEAQSGKEALKYLLDQEFAVILLDVMMPEMDGFEVARIVREREKSKHTPIIFVTAMFLDDQDAFRGYSVGAVDYIMKPFAPEILRSKVTVFVDLFRKTEEIKRQSEHIRAMEQREYSAKLLATEQRLQQEADRVRNEARAIRSVLEHAPVGYARLDKNHKFIETNKMFADQFSLKEDVVDQSIFAALPGLPAAVRDAVENSRPYLVHDLQVYEGTGGETNRYCDLAVWPTSNREQFNGTILIGTDVTERVLLDLQRKDFVATLAHDLQTPVIASDRALLLLLGKIDGSVSPDLVSFVGMLKKNNENLLHMIESLLDIYHYEEGAKALYRDEVDLKLLAMTCLDELSALAVEQEIRLNSDFPADLHSVYADRTAIRRVITNLLDNALKFSKGGTVTARARNDGDMVVFEVTDTGIGIKPEDKSHLFERYWHGTGHKSYKGSSGLGLYLCRQIVESHNGQIECDTSVAKMTTFRFTLPVRTADESEQKVDSPRLKQSAL